MDVSGILKGIEGNADKIGAVLGSYMYAGIQGGGDALRGYSDLVQGLATSPHIPDFSHVAFNLFTNPPTKKMFMGSLTAIILGWLAKEVDVHPMVSRVGNLAMKLGMGAAIGQGVTTLAYFAGAAHSDGGADHGMHHALYQKPQAGWAGRFTMPTVAPTRNIGTVVAGVPRPN